MTNAFCIQQFETFPTLVTDVKSALFRQRHTHTHICVSGRPVLTVCVCQCTERVIKSDTAFGMVFLLGKFLLARCIASHLNCYRTWSVTVSAKTVRHVAFSRIIPKNLIMGGILPSDINSKQRKDILQ